MEGEKFKLRKLPSRTSSLLSSRRTAYPVLKHNRISEVFNRFKLHDFEHYVKETAFRYGNLINDNRNVSLTFYLCER